MPLTDEAAARFSDDDRAAVAAQLGREPRGVIDVAHRCACGRPDVVRTSPRLPDGTPFPTLYYLTCPRLASAIGTLESSGLMRDMESRLAEDAELAQAYREAHERYVDELSGIDLVVANAGVGRQRPASRLTWADVEPVMRVNALGAMATLVALLPRMAERGSGTLVGVSSLAALRALPATAAYGASKAALTSFIDSLRLDLRGTGVHAMTVHPGFVESAMTAKNHFKMPFLLTADAAAERMVRAIEARTPLYEFPVPTALAMHAAAWVPRWAFERAMKMPKSSAKPKAG